METLVLPHDLTHQCFLLVILAILPFIFTYSITSLTAAIIPNVDGKGVQPPDAHYGVPWIGHGLPFLRASVVLLGDDRLAVCPPVAPYWIPWVGHGLAFFIDPTRLALSVKTRFRQGLVRLTFFGVEVCMVSGFDAVNAVWKAKCLDSKPAVCIAMERFFGTTKRALRFYNEDDSGISLQPHPESRIEPEHRVYYHTHKVTQEFMSGPGLAVFTSRFQDSLRTQISKSEINENWVELPDLFSFLRDMLSTAAVTTMCGPSLLALSPNMVQDLWDFDRSLPSFFKGYPRWLAPKAWKSRQRCLDNFKRWQAFAAQNFDNSCIGKDGHDPYYGAPLMRSRQEYFSKMESLDQDALASENVGLMWAENANSVPATCWFVIEAVYNADLLHRIREEIQASLSDTELGHTKFAVDKLCSQTLLQSVFAETLRLRTIQFIVRGSDHENFKFKNWLIPKGKIVAVDTHTAHTDEEVWGTGDPNDSHPVKTFWAERFLVYPSDPNSGPLKHKEHLREGLANNPNPSDSSKGPIFSLSGLAGAWIPFGGGRRQCPGSKFAKQEIILGAAMFCSSFDIEPCSAAKPEPNMDYYGLGGLPPQQKIPVRIRRRNLGCRG